MASIFISYRRQDTGGHAGRLRATLKQRYGRRAVFADFDSIHGGANYRARIEEAIESSEVALVLVGANWAGHRPTPTGMYAQRRIDDEGDVLRREIAAALARDHVTVIPVLVEGAELPAELPGEIAGLRDLHACTLSNGQWQSDFERIARDIDAAMPRGGIAGLALRGRVALGGRARYAALAIGAVAAAVLGLSLLGQDPDPSTCTNLAIRPDVRAELSKAAGKSQDAVEGSVYYGGCGQRTWALASFPDGSDGVFVEDGLRWRRLGSIPAVKCARVPRELLGIWGQDDC